MLTFWTLGTFAVGAQDCVDPTLINPDAVCTEEFDTDWNELMQHFGLPSLPVTHRHAWNDGKR